MNSPKNKFFGTVDMVIAKHSNETKTSPTSVTGNSVAEVMKKLTMLVKTNKHVSGDHQVVIRENKAVYPSFDWEEIEKTNINA